MIIASHFIVLTPQIKIYSPKPHFANDFPETNDPLI